MTPTEIATYWDARHESVLPLPDALREHYSNRWVRFTTLAKGKRHPNSDLERATVLTRYNTILAQMFSENMPFVLVTTGYSTNTRPGRDDAALETFDPHAFWWRSVEMQEVTTTRSGPTYGHLFASTWQWREGALDSLLALAAVDQVSSMLVLDLTHHRLFYPFGGGCDVFLRNSKERDAFKTQFHFWLSG